MAQDNPLRNSSSVSSPVSSERRVSQYPTSHRSLKKCGQLGPSLCVFTVTMILALFMALVIIWRYSATWMFRNSRKAAAAISICLWLLHHFGLSKLLLLEAGNVEKNEKTDRMRVCNASRDSSLGHWVSLSRILGNPGRNHRPRAAQQCHSDFKRVRIIHGNMARTAYSSKHAYTIVLRWKIKGTLPVRVGDYVHTGALLRSHHGPVNAETPLNDIDMLQGAIHVLQNTIKSIKIFFNINFEA